MASFYAQETPGGARPSASITTKFVPCCVSRRGQVSPVAAELARSRSTRVSCKNSTSILHNPCGHGGNGGGGPIGVPPPPDPPPPPPNYPWGQRSPAFGRFFASSGEGGSTTPLATAGRSRGQPATSP